MLKVSLLIAAFWRYAGRSSEPPWDTQDPELLREVQGWREAGRTCPQLEALLPYLEPQAPLESLQAAQANGLHAEQLERALREPGLTPERYQELSTELAACCQQESARGGSVKAALAFQRHLAWMVSRVRYV